MQLDEQQESMLDLSAGEGPPAMAGAPLRVSFEDPRPGGQKIEKVRLLGLTGVMVGLIVFGIGWRSFRSAKSAGPAEAPVAADAGKATGADAASVQPEPVVEAGAPDPELSAHDGGTAP